VFLQVTKLQNNKEISMLLNSDKIVSITENDFDTLIFLDSGDMLTVKETKLELINQL